MKNPPLRPPRPRRAGFTLVEIMIVVVIIGLLAAMAIPAFRRVRESAQNARFVSDLRTFSQAFETYSLRNGAWPPNASTWEVSLAGFILGVGVASAYVSLTVIAFSTIAIT